MYMHAGLAILDQYIYIKVVSSLFYTFIQVDKIAPLYGLDARRPIWLVKKEGNLAILEEQKNLMVPL